MICHQQLELLADAVDRYAVFTPYGPPGPLLGGRITLSSGVSISVSDCGRRNGSFEMAAWIDDGPTTIIGYASSIEDVAAVVGAVADGDADLSRLA